MKRMIIVAVVIALLLQSLSLLGGTSKGEGRRVSIGFWNVENLYDTVPSLFYEDSDYTPGGKNQWGGVRYAQKLQNLSQIIDEMSLDIIGLAEVESEAVLRDLVKTLRTDYNYIHQNSNDRRGMDVVLLYKGDKFIPEQVRLVESGTSRQFLYVRGTLYGQRIDLIVCHLPSKYNNSRHRTKVLNNLYQYAEALQNSDGSAKPIIMGDFNASPRDRAMRKGFISPRGDLRGFVGFFSPLSEATLKGVGSYAYGGSWQLLDNIFLSRRYIAGQSVAYDGECGVFIKEQMLDNDSPHRLGYPRRTFSGGNYIGGYSDHLPVYLYLKLSDL